MIIMEFLPTNFHLSDLSLKGFAEPKARHIDRYHTTSSRKILEPTEDSVMITLRALQSYSKSGPNTSLTLLASGSIEHTQATSWAKVKKTICFIKSEKVKLTLIKKLNQDLNPDRLTRLNIDQTQLLNDAQRGLEKFYSCTGRVESVRTLLETFQSWRNPSSPRIVHFEKSRFTSPRKNQVIDCTPFISSISPFSPESTPFRSPSTLPTPSLSPPTILEAALPEDQSPILHLPTAPEKPSVPPISAGTIINFGRSDFNEESFTLEALKIIQAPLNESQTTKCHYYYHSVIISELPKAEQEAFILHLDSLYSFETYKRYLGSTPPITAIIRTTLYPSYSAVGDTGTCFKVKSSHELLFVHHPTQIMHTIEEPSLQTLLESAPSIQNSLFKPPLFQHNGSR